MTPRRRKAAPKADPHAPMPVHLRPGMSPEEIYAAYGMTCPPRIATLRDPTRRTYGPAVARVSSQLGMPMMPHQRYAADVTLEVDNETNALAYRDVTLLKPRQSGKTTIVLSVKTHRALAFPAEVRRWAPDQRGKQRILYGAQKRNDAREKWVDDHLPLLDASPFKNRYRARLANGSEALIWKTGAVDGITSNTETAGHGKVLDLGFEDEFFAAVDHRLEQAFSPAMITRWSPQHWRVSTEGTESSLYLADKVDKGRAAVAAGLRNNIAYLEWSNLDDPYDDPRTWLSCMPGLCPLPTGECTCGVDASGRRWWRHTARLATIRAELLKHGLEEFGRAYLNRRKGSKPPPDPNIPTRAQWDLLVDVKAAPSDVLAFGIDVNPARTAAAIVAVWLCDIATCASRWVTPITPDGREADPFAAAAAVEPAAAPELIEQTEPHRHIRLIEYLPGTGWVAKRARELNERWRPVAWALDPAGPAGSLITELHDVGITRPTGDPERGQLAILGAREAAAAFGMTVDGIRQKTIRHEGQAVLDDAYDGARTRPLGTDGGLAWGRKAAGADICPIVAGSGALWALEARKHLAEPDELDPSAFYLD